MNAQPKPIPIEDGIYEGTPDAEYRRWCAMDGSPRLSKSILSYCNLTDDRQDMAQLKLAIDGEFPFKDTPALRFGRAFDMRLLDPKLFKQTVAVGGPINDKTGRPYGEETKAFDAWWQDKAAEGFREFITVAESEMIERMRAAVVNHAAVNMIRKAGGVQTSIAWTGPSGVPLRARLDKWIERYNGCATIVDVKTIRDVRDRTIRNQILDYGYHIQCAMYRDGIHRLTGHMPSFKLLFVSKSIHPKVRIATMEHSGLGQAYTDLGRAQYTSALRQYADCLKTGVWPEPYPDQEDLLAPGWVEKKVETYGNLGE